uniref:DM2 domain-containing protein n=1 Tax=Corethron hystrix TaxID=216773 RepID=A0A7S1FRF2_9STRA|mmetsp:Transcript_22813/g.52290  ORF Transcript_22813/g.52290 Transcript_22813/m.52290 type:complete len:107 (+) Transcript_22813:59-379(+)
MPGFSKAYRVSSSLSSLIRKTREYNSECIMSRQEVTKKIWEYIKINKLQKPGDGRIILCDEKMREVFFPPPIGLSDVNKHIEGHVDGKEIHMLKLQKYLTPHLCEP